MAQQPEREAGARADEAHRPVVHPGGRAEESGTGEAARGGQGQQGRPGTDSPEAQGSRTPAGEEPAVQVERESESAIWRARVAEYRKLLRDCRNIQLVDLNLLSLQGWPESRELALAARRRDYTLLALAGFAVVFGAGLMGLIPAWLGGAGFGALIAGLVLTLSPVQRMLGLGPGYWELRRERRELLREARLHIRHLEGREGLAWRFERLTDFNPSLRRSVFGGLYRLSMTGDLAAFITTRAHVRLYLLFVLEAERAYARLEQAYREEASRGLDEGWSSTP